MVYFVFFLESILNGCGYFLLLDADYTMHTVWTVIYDVCGYIVRTIVYIFFSVNF